MDDNGNILARRYSKTNIYVKGAGSLPNEETAIGSEVMKSANQSLEMEKVMKVCFLAAFSEIKTQFPSNLRFSTWKNFNQTSIES